MVEILKFLSRNRPLLLKAGARKGMEMARVGMRERPKAARRAEFLSNVVAETAADDDEVVEEEEEEAATDDVRGRSTAVANCEELWESSVTIARGGWRTVGELPGEEEEGEDAEEGEEEEEEEEEDEGEETDEIMDDTEEANEEDESDPGWFSVGCGSLGSLDPES